MKDLKLEVHKMVKKLRDETLMENNKRINEHGNLLLETNVLNSKVHRQRVDHNKIVERIETQSEQLSEVQRQLLIVDTLKEGRTEHNTLLELVNDKINVINDKLDAHRSNSDKIEMFIDKYIPIRIQSQISETLQCILTRQLLNKLEFYEHDKFRQLNEDILNDDVRSLD